MLKIDNVSVHPNYTVLSSQYFSDNGELYHNGRSDIPTKKILNVHKLSDQSKRKMKKAITYMSHTAKEKKIYNSKFNSTFKFKLSFVTLTLSSTQIHSDQEIKLNLLHPFLDYLQKCHRVRKYIWKAERQKNGNIHFHLVLDQYVSYVTIRDHWNKIQDKLGYIARYYAKSHRSNHVSHKGMISELLNSHIAGSEAMAIPSNLNEYYAVNSTDVHSVRRVKDISRYLIKYMVKDSNRSKIKCHRSNCYYYEEPRHFQCTVSYGAKSFLKSCISVGRLWGCSHNLSNITGGRDVMHAKISDEITRLIDSGVCYVKSDEHFCYIGYNYTDLISLKCTNLIYLLNTYLVDHFSEPIPIELQL